MAAGCSHACTWHVVGMQAEQPRCYLVAVRTECTQSVVRVFIGRWMAHGEVCVVPVVSSADGWCSLQVV